jgi:hypothetical protein
MPGQSVNTNAGTVAAGSGSGSNKPLCRREQLVHPPLVDQFHLVDVFDRAIAGREVPPHDFDGDDRPTHRERQRVDRLQSAVLVNASAMSRLAAVSTSRRTRSAVTCVRCCRAATAAWTAV